MDGLWDWQLEHYSGRGLDGGFNSLLLLSALDSNTVVDIIGFLICLFGADEDGLEVIDLISFPDIFEILVL